MSRHFGFATAFNFTSAHCSDIPFREALQDLGQATIMQEEFDSFLKNEELIELCHHEGMLDYQSGYTNLFNMQIDQVGNYPTRICWRHNQLQEELNQLRLQYDKFAPVVSQSAFRAIITRSDAVGWPINHMDVITTFLHETLSLYMQQPPGFE